MDELMARFELNLEREKYMDSYNESKEILEQKSLLKVPIHIIEESVRTSMAAFEGLF